MVSIAVYHEYSCRSISIDRLLARVVGSSLRRIRYAREKGVGSSWFERSIEHLYRGESGSGFKVLK